MCAYKSFCWSIGTTSFRTSDFNLKIERQLALLNEFRAAHFSERWEGNAALQAQYYDFLQKEGFLTGKAARKDKDARQKTSGLRDIGLIDAERRLTPVGKHLLEISQQGNFGLYDNILQISADSFLYFKQLLKTYVKVETQVLRPFAVFVLMLDELKFLTTEEFTFLMPLVTSEGSLRSIINKIKRLRCGETSIDDIIIETLMSMENYEEALSRFLAGTTNEKLVCEIGINRKSAKYDKPYYTLYLALCNLQCDNSDSLVQLFNSCSQIKIGTLWKKRLFTATSEAAIRRDPAHALTGDPILTCADEHELKIRFFKLMHLLKARATLSDYHDLNRRYFKVTDVVTFDDDKIEFTLLAKCFFAFCRDGVRKIAFTTATNIGEDSELGEIIPQYAVSLEDIRKKLQTDFDLQVSSARDVYKVVAEERRKRFNHLIDTKFPDNILLTLLDDFEKRNDDSIRSKITDNADIPTLFEYIIGVIWYKISNRCGDILSAFNLSLDADLLPRTHACGGTEDITYRYDACDDYGKQLC